MSLPTLMPAVEALVVLYREHFNRDAGELWIKRVTAAPPEAVNEWPWLYWTVEDGDCGLLTFRTALNALPQRPRAFGATSDATVTRPKLDVTHRLKAQLLVTPRRDLLRDELVTRPFVEPFLILAAENITLGGLAEHCYVTGYRYGVFQAGRVAEKTVEFLGIEFNFELKCIL